MPLRVFFMLKKLSPVAEACVIAKSFAKGFGHRRKLLATCDLAKDSAKKQGNPDGAS